VKSFFICVYQQNLNIKFQFSLFSPKSSTYKLDLDIHEVRWGKGGTVRARDYIFFLWKRNKNRQLGTGFFVHHRVVSAVKSVEFVSEGMSYIVLRGRCCNIIVLNVHVPSDGKSDDSKENICEE